MAADTIPLFQGRQGTFILLEDTVKAREDALLPVALVSVGQPTTLRTIQIAAGRRLLLHALVQAKCLGARAV